MTQATGKKGQHTDYVKRQYIGNLGKIENIVAVTAMVINNITVPLLFGSTNPKNDLNQRIATAANQDCSRNDETSKQWDFGSA